MGGQACILYGAAEFSRNLDLLRASQKGEIHSIEIALQEEEQIEKEADRLYWAPLRAELEKWRQERRLKKSA